MRVAFYAPMKSPTSTVPSGDLRMARALMQALRLAGHDVALACRFSSRDGAGDDARQRRLGALGERLADKLAARLLRRPKDGRPQAWLTYHLYHKAPDHLGPRVADALGIPYLVAEASSAPKQAGGKWDFGHRAADRAIARADLVFGLNSNDRAGVLPLLKSPERWVPLTPFIDVAPFAAAARERARHRAYWAKRSGAAATRPWPERPWIVTVAMMRAGEKRQSYALLAQTLSRFGKPLALIAGDGPLGAEIRSELAAAAPGRVHLLGRLGEDDMPGLLAACDLFVWPAVGEAYGMALVEAQAAGLPVIAGREGGVGDIVVDGESGLLAKPRDASALAACVARVLDDPALRARLAQGARERADTALDIAQAARTLDAALKRVTGHG